MVENQTKENLIDMRSPHPLERGPSLSSVPQPVNYNGWVCKPIEAYPNDKAQPVSELVVADEEKLTDAEREEQLRNNLQNLSNKLDLNQKHDS